MCAVTMCFSRTQYESKPPACKPCRGPAGSSNKFDFFPTFKSRPSQQMLMEQQRQHQNQQQPASLSSVRDNNNNERDKKRFHQLTVFSREDKRNSIYKIPQKRHHAQNYNKQPSDKKYWTRRYSLFSRFDQGIRLDQESWFSVTPEQLAKHHAQRMTCDVIVDGFCGAGGNAIQFARTYKKVIAIDHDPVKIELAKHNAAIYGVEHKIHFIVGDFLKLAPCLKADMVFLSPPWGGPDYVKEDVFCLDTMLLPVSMDELLRAAEAVSPNIAAFLPKNSNTDMLSKKYRVEIEVNYVGKYKNAITAYWGGLARSSNTECYVPFM